MTRLETTQSELEASNEAAAAAAAAAEGDVKAARAQASAAAAELEMVERAAEEAAVEVDAANARADGRRLSLPHTRPLTSYVLNAAVLKPLATTKATTLIAA